jgi:hypothetical protein
VAGPLRFAIGLVGRPVLLLKNGADAAFETGLLGNIEVGAVGPLFIGFAGESLVRLAPVAAALGSPFGFRASSERARAVMTAPAPAATGLLRSASASWRIVVYL